MDKISRGPLLPLLPVADTIPDSKYHFCVATNGSRIFSTKCDAVCAGWWLRRWIYFHRLWYRLRLLLYCSGSIILDSKVGGMLNELKKNLVRMCEDET